VSSEDRTFWHPARLSRLAVTVWLGLAIAAVVVVARDTTKSSMLLAGDFPGFYTPAVLIQRGETARYYDAELQRAIHNEFWPSPERSFLMSVYPPYTGILLRPLAELSADQARMVWHLLSLLTFGVAMWSVARLNPDVARHPWLTSAYAALFLPLTIAIVGGQNTPMSMALYGGALLFSRQGTKRGDLVAGALLGAWGYKPQFAIIAIALPLLARRWRVLAGALLVTGIYYLMGASLLGWAWPKAWSDAVAYFAPRNFVSNAPAMVSIIGTLKAVALSTGVGASVFSALGWTLGTTLLLWLGWRTVRNGPSAFERSLLLLGPVVCLASPQTLFYDLGIGLLPCLAVARPLTDSSVQSGLLLLVVAAVVTMFRTFLPVPVFGVFAGAMLVWVLRAPRPTALTRGLPAQGTFQALPKQASRI